MDCKSCLKRFHQNDHHRQKEEKFLEFHCDHFKGLHCRVLAVFQNVVVGHCFWRGVKHPDPHRSQPPAGGTSGGKLHEMGSQDENGEDKEHKGKKTIQRRRRRKPYGASAGR